MPITLYSLLLAMMANFDYLTAQPSQQRLYLAVSGNA
jgi:hypothetical protein